MLIFAHLNSFQYVIRSECSASNSCSDWMPRTYVGRVGRWGKEEKDGVMVNPKVKKWAIRSKNIHASKSIKI